MNIVDSFHFPDPWREVGGGGIFFRFGIPFKTAEIPKRSSLLAFCGLLFRQWMRGRRRTSTTCGAEPNSTSPGHRCSFTQSLFPSAPPIQLHQRGTPAKPLLPSSMFQLVGSWFSPCPAEHSRRFAVRTPLQASPGSHRVSAPSGSERPSVAWHRSTTARRRTPRRTRPPAHQPPCELLHLRNSFWAM